MRLKILNSGYDFGTKVLFAFIQLVSRHPVPDAARLVFYRPEFYGAPMKVFTQEAMRGPSAWSVGDRELMAAVVSQMNECAFCIRAHTATAAMAYQDEAKVQALRLLGKLTREHAVTADDMRSVLAAGVSREQIEDALAVSFAFNTTDRLADAFGFFVPGPKAFEAGARFLLRRGYQ
jgi:AhpD family alkylhydroperoxidase